jgi:hypothetical protein
MDLVAVAATAISAEEALRLNQTRKAPKKCRVNGCPAPAHCPGAYLRDLFSNLGDGNQSGESIMQELAKTASRVDALDTQTVPVVGYYYNPITNRCVISNVFLQEPFSFLSFYFISPLSFFIPVPTFLFFAPLWNLSSSSSTSMEFSPSK